MRNIIDEARKKETAKRWREKNKDYYNTYMREYMKTYNNKHDLKFKTRTSYGIRKLERKNRLMPLVSFSNKPVIVIFE